MTSFGSRAAALFCLAQAFSTVDTCRWVRVIFAPCEETNACEQAEIIEGVCERTEIDGCCLSSSDCPTAGECEIIECDPLTNRCITAKDPECPKDCDPACDDGNPCTEDVCMNEECEYPVLTECCVDDTICEPCGVEKCEENKCVSTGLTPREGCNDEKECTIDECTGDGCVHTRGGCARGFVCTDNLDCEICSVTAAVEPGCPGGGRPFVDRTRLKVPFETKFDGLGVTEPQRERIEYLIDSGAAEWSLPTALTIARASSEAETDESGGDEPLLEIVLCGDDAVDARCRSLYEGTCLACVGYTQPVNGDTPIYMLLDARAVARDVEHAFYAAILHEFGHAAGLTHLLDDDAVMRQRFRVERIRTDVLDNLTAADKAALVQLIEEPAGGTARRRVDDFDCTDGLAVVDPSDDPDQDGLPTEFEQFESLTDPANNDTDGDGLLDGCELLLGTDANDPDSDRDGRGDGDEVANGREPRSPVICDDATLAEGVIALAPEYLDDFDISEGASVVVENLEVGCSTPMLVEAGTIGSCGASFARRTREDSLCIRRAELPVPLRICGPGSEDRVVQDFEAALEASEVTAVPDTWRPVGESGNRSLEFDWVVADETPRPFIQFPVDPLGVVACDNAQVTLLGSVDREVLVEFLGASDRPVAAATLRLFVGSSELVRAPVEGAATLSAVRLTIADAIAADTNAGTLSIGAITIQKASFDPGTVCPPDCPPAPGECDLLIWADNSRDGAITTVRLDGLASRSIPTETPYGLAIDDAGTLHWTADGLVDEVYASRIDLSERELTGANELACPRGVAVDPSGSPVYVADPCADAIVKFNQDGTDETLDFPGAPNDIVFHAAGPHLYFSDQQDIYRINPNLTELTLFEPRLGPEQEALDNPQALALYGDFLYWADLFDDTIYRANLVDPEERVEVVLNLGQRSDGDRRIEFLAIDAEGTRIFWTDNGSQERVESADLLESGLADPATVRTIRTNIDEPRGILVARTADAMCD